MASWSANAARGGGGSLVTRQSFDSYKHCLALGDQGAYFILILMQEEQIVEDSLAMPASMVSKSCFRLTGTAVAIDHVQRPGIPEFIHSLALHREPE